MHPSLSAQTFAYAVLQGQDFFHIMWEGVSDAMALVAPTGTILAVNPAFLKLFRLRPGQVVGKSFEALVPAESSAALIEQFSRVVDAQAFPWRTSFEVHCGDGTCLWVESHISVVKQGDQGVAALAILRDNAVQKQAEDQQAALRESEARFRTSVESLLSAFAILSAVRDAGGRIVDFRFDYVNEVACRLNRMPREAHLGHLLAELLPAHRRLGLIEVYARVVETGEPFTSLSMAYEDEDAGQHLTHAIDIQVTRLGDGIVATWRDVTEQRRMEEQFRFQAELLQTAGQAVIATRPDGQIVYWNAAAEFLYGWRAEEVLGRNISDVTVTSSAAAQAQAAAIMAALNQGRPWSGEFTVRRKDGTAFVALVMDTPVRGPDGALTAIIGTSVDVSEQRRLMDRLRYQADVLESINDAVIGTDLDFRITSWNRAAERLYGWTAEEVLGRVSEEVMRSQLSDEQRAALARQIREGQPVAATVTQMTRGGERRVVSGYVMPMHDSRGQVTGYVAVNRDVTDQSRTEAALRASDERQSFLVKLGDALRLISDPEQIQAAVTRIVMDHYAADHCFYCEIEDDTAIIRQDASREGLPSVADVYALSGLPILKAASQAGQPLVVADVYATDLIDAELKQLCIRLQIISSINVPVMKNGQWAGTLCITQRIPRNWTNLEVELAAETAERTWAAVERARAEEALRESETLYRTLHENLRDAFVQVDMDGNITDFNDIYCQMLGYSRAELGTLTYQELTPRRWHELENRIVAEQILPKGFSDIYEKEYQRKDGTAFPVELRTILVRDRSGQPSAMWAIIRDITERKRAEKALRESEARLAVELADTQQLQRISSSLIKGDEIGALYDQILDAARALMSSDMASLQMFILERRALFLLTQHGLAPESAQFWEWVRADDTTSCGLALSRVETVVVPDVEQWEFVTGTEDLAHYQRCGIRAILSMPLLSRDGRPVGMISTHWREVHRPTERELRLLGMLARHAADLIERRLAEQERERLLEAETQARREAERQNELRLRFLGMISHELRTPLTSIKGFATTLLAEDVAWSADQQHDFLRTIDAEADKLTDMIDQLLDLSRIESGTLRVEPQPQPLDSILSAALLTLKQTTAAHAFTTGIPAGLPLVRADSQRIRQVLVNLVDNAAKYCPPGTRIEVSAEPDGEVLRVSVCDKGPGISREDRQFVFEAFRRGSETYARRKKGAGLGLAICKGIIEAHGGRIWIEDHGGPGTTVSFTLPLAR
jgi:PAS domain S-box-containing protein